MATHVRADNCWQHEPDASHTLTGGAEVLADETHGEAYERGEQLRRAVLGDTHVDLSLQRVTDFSRPLQELVTEYCWGVVWSRSALPPKTRSLLNLAMLTALNRQHEFAVHVRGALRNGVTVEELQEVLLQTAVYVGAPAALEAFRIAERVITEYNATNDGHADGRADGHIAHPNNSPPTEQLHSAGA